MKSSIHLFQILLLTLSSSFLHADQEKFPIQLLPKAPESEEETFYLVKDREVQVNGSVIRVIGIKGERVTVSYKNTTTKTLIPQYTIKFYNGYGILLGSDEIRAGILSGNPRLQPGDFGGDKLHIDWLDIPSIFQHSDLSTTFLPPNGYLCPKPTSKRPPKNKLRGLST